MKKGITYSVAVCCISWAVFCVVYAACGFDFSDKPAVLSIVKTFYMLLPMAVAMVLQKIGKEPFKSTGLLNFRISWSWLWALALPVAYMLLSILTCAMLPGIRLEYNADHFISLNGLDGQTADLLKSQISAIPPAAVLVSTLFNGMLAGCTINGLFAFGEEYGWRNYMASALKGQNFWKAAAIIGAVWGIWHMPLILMGHNYPQHPIAGVGMMCIFCILLGVLELWVLKKTGSVIAVAVMHGTVNGVTPNSLLFINGGNDLTGITGLGGFIALALIIALLAFWDSRHERIMFGRL